MTVTAFESDLWAATPAAVSETSDPPRVDPWLVGLLHRLVALLALLVALPLLVALAVLIRVQVLQGKGAY